LRDGAKSVAEPNLVSALEIHGNTRGQDIKQLARREGCCWIVVVGKLGTGSASCRRVPFASLPATLSNRCSSPIPWSLVLQGWPASVPGDKGSPDPEEAQNQKRSLAPPLKCLPPSPSSSGQRWRVHMPKRQHHGWQRLSVPIEFEVSMEKRGHSRLQSRRPVIFFSRFLDGVAVSGGMGPP
jgi:hypothetical protein